MNICYYFQENGGEGGNLNLNKYYAEKFIETTGI